MLVYVHEGVHLCVNKLKIIYLTEAVVNVLNTPQVQNYVHPSDKNMLIQYDAH